MAQTVREILQRDKVPNEFPPSMMDVKTREKHVPQSIDYNIKHFKDHGHNVSEQLKKLKMVNPSLAKQYAAKSCKVIEQIHREIKAYE
jgi:hypothetical protein